MNKSVLMKMFLFMTVQRVFRRQNASFSVHFFVGSLFLFLFLFFGGPLMINDAAFSFYKGKR